MPIYVIAKEEPKRHSKRGAKEASQPWSQRGLANVEPKRHSKRRAKEASPFERKRTIGEG